MLSSLIGWERAAQQKSAGLRTHTLVGIASALMMEVSQHGFTAVLGLENVSFDPSRVAAQIVSGIGFIGGGLIFVRRDAVRGLTTAATIWLTCAVGMACGGGLPILALAVTALHFLVVRGYPRLTSPPGPRHGGRRLRGPPDLPHRFGAAATADAGLHPARLPHRAGQGGTAARPHRRRRAVLLQLEGTEDPSRLASELFLDDGVLDVELTAASDDE